MQMTSLPNGANRLRWFGLLMVAIGAAGWWYNWHLAATQNQFSIKLCLLGPLGVFGGLLMALRPEWAGPLRSDSTRTHRISMFGVMGLMFAFSGIDFYLLKTGRPPLLSRTAFAGTVASAAANTPQVRFQGRSYQLASFNQKQNATWEFVAPQERIDDWKTLVTIVDRPDARTKEDLDRLAEGLMNTYKSHGGRILMAKTMGQSSGSPYNYMVAAFEEPGKHRVELNFVRMALGEKNAAVVIYGVRITDPNDYMSKGKQFLDQSSGVVGRELAAIALPDLSKLPRKDF